MVSENHVQQRTNCLFDSILSILREANKFSSVNFDRHDHVTSHDLSISNSMMLQPVPVMAAVSSAGHLNIVFLLAGTAVL